MNPSSSLISLHDVCFSYQETPVLKNISFTVNFGEFIGIIGPNGGGKTTLIKILLGFLKPRSGTIFMFGQTENSSRRQMAYVPQSLHFDKDFPVSVLELVLQGRLFNLPWYGCFHQSDKEKALAALDKVGLLDFQSRPFGSLSGGQAQRALIARAIASEPNILLLDEPTASVDAHAESDIYKILRELKQQMTIMMVTHNLQAAVELFDRVICVQETASIMNPEQLCEHFAHGLYHTPLIKLSK